MTGRQYNLNNVYANIEVLQKKRQRRKELMISFPFKMRKQLEIWCLLHLCVHSRLCFCNHQLRRTLDVQGLFLFLFIHLYTRGFFCLFFFFFNACACMGLCVSHVRCQKRPECIRSPGTEAIATSAVLDWELTKPRPALRESSELS